MEYLELIKFVVDMGVAAIVAVVGLAVWRSREKTDLAASANVQTSLQTTQGMVEIFGDLSTNIKTSTSVLEGLKKTTDETGALLAGMRREVQLVHANHTEALTAIQQVLALLPDATAGKIKEDLLPPIVTIREQLAAAGLQIASACLKLDQLVAAQNEDVLVIDDKKSDVPPPGETPAEGVVQTEEKKV